MAKIILNDEEFNFQSYNRNTYFSDETIASSGYIGELTGTNLANRLQTLAQSPLTSLVIKTDDDTIIYSLNNIDAIITNITENYNGADAVITGLNLQFNQ